MPEKSKSEQEHWRRLAEELGLPFDDSHEPVDEPISKESPAASPQAVLESSPFTEPFDEPAPFHPAASRPIADVLQSYHEDDTTITAAAAPPDALELESGEEEAKSRVRLEPVETTGDDQPRRGRGRRRRGRGRGERRPSDEVAVAAAHAAIDGEATTDAIVVGPGLPALEEGAEDETSAEKDGEESTDGEQAGRRKRRRRRRRRKPDEIGASGEPAAETVPAIAAEKPAPRPSAVEEFADDLDEDEGESNDQPRGADTDDEPEEDFSDWDVPSWNELIGSLYRPER